MDGERLRRLAAARFGLFTRAQALACGYSAYQIRRRLQTGEWQRVLGSTLAFAGLRVTALIRDRAGQLAVPRSVLAGPSAARLHGMPVADTGQYLYVGRHGCSRVQGVRLLYELPSPRDIQRDQGQPVVCRALAVVDCLRLLGWTEAVALADRALQQRWITMAELRARVTDRFGRPGAPQLSRLMRLMGGGERAPSERLLTTLLRGAGIRGWAANVAIRDEHGRLVGVGDVAFERHRVVLEVDGWAYHSTPERFVGDRRRQNVLVAAGWRVLRFTWSDLTERPELVVAVVRQVLDGRTRA